MILFPAAGPEHTQQTLRLAVEKADEMQAALVVASGGGETANALLQQMEQLGCRVPVAVVTSVYGMKEPGKNRFPEETRRELEAKGVAVVTAAHVLSGAERAFSNRFQGQGPTEIMAHTLRMFSQGVKVCVECSVMALDAGRIPYGKPVVAIGGTGRGADTAVVLTPGYTHTILETRIHEILCKPY